MKQNKYYIKADRAFLEEGIRNDVFVLVSDGVIQQISTSLSCDAPVIDAKGLDLLPGFIDLHIHGRNGSDIMDGTPEAIEVISNSLAEHGVTGFLATTVTSTWPQTQQAFRNIGECYQQQPSGAKLLGAYNEGLFFTKGHKGAHDEAYFLPLEPKYIEEIFNLSAGALKVVALAPELPHSDNFIKHLTRLGIKPMLGHTSANYEQTKRALCYGACGGVHVFNGMTGIHHREPGCAGAVLVDDDAYVEVIADGVHLHPAILELIHKVKQKDKIGLISDCIVAGGLSDGQYRLGMLDVDVEKGIARTHSGSLAGSTLTLERAVSNLIKLTSVTELDAVHMASWYPAKFLGVDEQVGSIRVGKQANFCLVNEAFENQLTIIEGNIVFDIAKIR